MTKKKNKRADSRSLMVRKASESDVPDIVKLNMQLADYHRRIDEYYKSGKGRCSSFKPYINEVMKKKNAKVLVAKIDSKVIGYLIGEIIPARPYLTPKKIGKVANAFVDAKYQRCGAGKMMFSELIAWFKKNNIKHIELTVDVRNKIGISAWEKFGFKEYMKKMRLDL